MPFPRFFRILVDRLGLAEEQGVERWEAAGRITLRESGFTLQPCHTVLTTKGFYKPKNVQNLYYKEQEELIKRAEEWQARAERAEAELAEACAAEELGLVKRNVTCIHHDELMTTPWAPIQVHVTSKWVPPLLAPAPMSRA